VEKVSVPNRTRYVAQQDIRISIRDAEHGHLYYEIRVASRGDTGSQDTIIKNLNWLLMEAATGRKFLASAVIETPSRFTPESNDG